MEKEQQETEKAVESKSSTSWGERYEAAKGALPGAISSRLPTADEASRALDDVSKRVSAFGQSTNDAWSTVSKSTSERIKTVRERGGLQTREQFFAHSYSVANATEIPLNISLNQVGPLYYGVTKPGETFERRVPGLFFRVEVRPFVRESDAYDGWSVTWPILVLAGPAAAATSLIAIPFVALAAGGTALASLTSFGSSVASATATTVSAVGTGTATVAKWGTRATMLPKVRTKLIDAASANLENSKYSEAVKARVVKYLTDASENRAGEPEDAGERADRERAEKALAKERSTKLAEVDITGLDLQKVLKCETGDKKIDKELLKAFRKLEFKSSAFKAKQNPVLAVCGGPTIEERDGGKKQLLVFYPLFLQKIEVEAEPLSLEEQPPTESESAVFRDATVVDDASDAEKVARVAPKHAAEGASREDVDKAGERAIAE